MTRTAPETSATQRDAVPVAARDYLAGSADRGEGCGLIRPDGRIVAFGPSLLRELGFDGDDDLRGLSFANLWHHDERTAARAARRAAVRDGHARVDLDASYVCGEPGTCHVALEYVPSLGLIAMSLARGSVPAPA